MRLIYSFLSLALLSTPYTSFAQTPAVRVDLIVTAQTVTPFFYDGRALPSNGSTITATALPFQGTTIATNKYRYLWKIDGKLQNGGVATSNNTFTTTMPDGNQAQIGVTVLSLTGTQVATAQETVTAAQPTIYFYEINPLKGQSTHALVDGSRISKEDIIIKAEPYFLSTAIPKENLQSHWELQSKIVPANTSDTNTLTVTKEAAGNVARISYSVLNLTNFLQRANALLTLRF